MLLDSRHQPTPCDRRGRLNHIHRPANMIGVTHPRYAIIFAVKEFSWGCRLTRGEAAILAALLRSSG